MLKFVAIVAIVFGLIGSYRYFTIPSSIAKHNAKLEPELEAERIKAEQVKQARAKIFMQRLAEIESGQYKLEQLLVTQ